MDEISGTGQSPATQSQSDVSVDMTMLKKSHDMMKENAAELLATLPPPPRAPSPAGVGGHLDIQA